MGTIQFSSTDPQAVLPASYTFTAADAGTHTFTVTFKTAGAQSITATDTANGAIIGTEDNIIVQAAAAKSLQVTGFPTTTRPARPRHSPSPPTMPTATWPPATPARCTLPARDAQAILPANTTIVPEDQGTLSFTATLETAGTQSITATDTSNVEHHGNRVGITVQAAAASSLVSPASRRATRRVRRQYVTVTAYDPYGNWRPAISVPWRLPAATSKRVLPASYTFMPSDDGTHTFRRTLETAGTQSITATDPTSSITGTESGITVQAAAVETLASTGFPTSDTAGTSGSVTVTAYDAYGNVATGYTGTVALTSTTRRPSCPRTTRSPRPTAPTAFPVTLDTAGTSRSPRPIQATSSITGTESGIAVQAAAASDADRHRLSDQGHGGHGSGTVTVTAYDAYGNVATGYTGTVVSAAAIRTPCCRPVRHFPPRRGDPQLCGDARNRGDAIDHRDR